MDSMEDVDPSATGATEEEPDVAASAAAGDDPWKGYKDDVGGSGDDDDCPGKAVTGADFVAPQYKPYYDIEPGSEGGAGDSRPLPASQLMAEYGESSLPPPPPSSSRGRSIGRGWTSVARRNKGLVLLACGLLAIVLFGVVPKLRHEQSTQGLRGCADAPGFMPMNGKTCQAFVANVGRKALLDVRCGEGAGVGKMVRDFCRKSCGVCDYAPDVKASAPAPVPAPKQAPPVVESPPEAPKQASPAVTAPATIPPPAPKQAPPAVTAPASLPASGNKGTVEEQGKSDEGAGATAEDMSPEVVPAKNASQDTASAIVGAVLNSNPTVTATAIVAATAGGVTTGAAKEAVAVASTTEAPTVGEAVAATAAATMAAVTAATTAATTTSTTTTTTTTEKATVAAPVPAALPQGSAPDGCIDDDTIALPNDKTCATWVSHIGRANLKRTRCEGSAGGNLLVKDVCRAACGNCAR